MSHLKLTLHLGEFEKVFVLTIVVFNNNNEYVDEHWAIFNNKKQKNLNSNKKQR